MWQMWVVLAGVGVAVLFYCWERFPIEIVSAAIITVVLLFFQLFPLPDGNPDAKSVIEGLAAPALITILSLLIIGQGIFHTGAMEGPTRLLVSQYDQHPKATLVAVFAFVFIVSAFINNTPVVVMFVPILAAIAGRMGASPSKVMIPLSYLCILAGMTTLIGSSTNLLVNESLKDVTADPAQGIAGLELGFFGPTWPGVLLAGVGALYILFVLPRLLPDRDSMEKEIVGADGRQYIAQIDVTADHPLIGKRPVAGMFADLPNMTVRMIQRGEHALLPPFDQIELKAGDTVIIAATRRTLADLLSSRADFLRGMLQATAQDEAPNPGERLGLTEAVVAPGSRLIGRTIARIGFRHATGCIVLGVQRRSRMIRSRMGEIRLEAGDTLLLFGADASMRSLRADRDLLLLEWATTSIADPRRITAARLIFGGVVLLAATQALPILHASVLGAVLMIATGCLNIRQAARAVDIRVYLLIGSAIALGVALQATGGDYLMASSIVSIFAPFGPVALLSALYLLVALLTNVLSNNATAILFTPVALNAAEQIAAPGQPPEYMLFAMTVLFAANTCFATPIGYQTNLLVMGPGHYRFIDYLRAGAPLVVLIWLTYTAFIAVHYAV
jgi:di/tricarboxylate transporter